MPVGFPNPNRWTQRSKCRAPSLSPIITEPTFEDWARMSDTLSVTVPRSWASPITRSATWICGGSTKDVFGWISPSWIAPATVKALKVEPGS